MDDQNAMLEMVERFLADQCCRDLIRSVEGGRWPQQFWNECNELGLPLLMVSQDRGGIGCGWREAAPLFEAFGRHALPVPLGETIVAGWLLDQAGLEVPARPITLAAPLNPGETVVVAPHAHWCEDLVVSQSGCTTHYRLRPQDVVERGSIAREARGRIELSTLEIVQQKQSLADGLSAGATLRAAQIAGALSAIRDLSIDYANLRVQFGRPIGKFQAVQQALAQLAGEAAAANVGAAMAARALDEGSGIFHVAVGKIRAGEAAGTGATIAHQTHGAIGFTDEHRLHDLTRRLWTWRDDFGGERYWANRLGTMTIDSGIDAWSFITCATEKLDG